LFIAYKLETLTSLDVCIKSEHKLFVAKRATLNSRS